MDNTHTTAPHSLGLPLMVLAVSFVLLMGFNATQVWQDSKMLKENFNSQERNVTQSRKVAEQLQSLLLGANKLAEAGNKNAKTIIANLNRAGITISPNRENGAAPVAAERVGAPEAPAAPAQ